MQTQNPQQHEHEDVGAHDGVADHSRTWCVAAAAGAAGLLALAGWLVALGDLREDARRAVPLLVACGAAYGLTAVAIGRCWNGLGMRSRRTVLIAVITVAVSMRLLFLAIPPSLSDDIYRYRWDGKVQAAGLNPYAEPPAALALYELRDEYWERINYPRIRTIYPPLTQQLFAITYRLGDSLLAFRLAALAGDLVVIALLAACLHAWQRPRWLIALYALHPLPAVEFASSGHFDAWAMAAVLAALLAHTRQRSTVAAVALGAGILLKTWPLVFVPLLARRWSLRPLAALGATLVAGYLPYLDAGMSMAQPWLDYAGRWRFNDGTFWLLDRATGSLESAKALAAGLGTGLLWWLWRRDADPVRGGYWLLVAFILLMPTVHPWYMLWALPLAAAAGDRGWATLCALAPLAYAILIGAGGDSNVWIEPTWPRFAQYVPALAVWAWQVRRNGLPAPGPDDARASASGTTAVEPVGESG